MDRVLLGHGSGGELTHQLLNDVIFAEMSPLLPKVMDDATPLTVPQNIAITTDTFTVRPLFFPGGDIGKLAVNGTVNDLAVSTARPIAITLGLVIEEGFEIPALRKILRSIRLSAEEAGVKIVAGDTKVVEKGKADGIYINTTGIGELSGLGSLSPEPIQPGDKVIVSGTIGDHTAAILVARGELGITADIISDCANITPLVSMALGIGGIKWMRDPTRGGVATTLNELVMGKNFGIRLFEGAIPVKPQVKGIAHLLGIDTLYMACEGRVLIVAEPSTADRIVDTLRTHPLGEEAAVIGEITQDHPGRVRLKTRWAERFVPMLPGEMLPRIC